MLHILTFGLLLLGAAQAALFPDSKGCNGNWKLGTDGKCYLYPTYTASVEGAAAFCARKDGTVVASERANGVSIKTLLNINRYASRGSKFWLANAKGNRAGVCAVLNAQATPRSLGHIEWVPCDSAQSFVCVKDKVDIYKCPFEGDVDVTDFENYLFWPDCLEKFKPTIRVYRRSPTAEYDLKYPDYIANIDTLKSSMSAADWTAFTKRRSFFLAHGFINSGKDKWIQAQKDALLKVEDCNVFIIDWKDGASNKLYVTPAANTRTVGIVVGMIYDHLIDLGVPQENIGCAGHSLGAHVCGFSGKYNMHYIGRIYGMDPAKPEFDDKKPNFRLNKNQAQGVMNIHTGGNSGDEILINDYGTLLALGHADFYPNGGEDQPGCSDTGNAAGCSHDRSHELMTETILGGQCIGGQFNVTNCKENTAPMGYVWNGVPGIYYMTTNGKSQFCQGAAGVLYHDPTKPSTPKPISPCKPTASP